VLLSFCRCCFHASIFGGSERFLRLCMIAEDCERSQSKDKTALHTFSFLKGILCRYMASNVRGEPD
jgi:hypothetical protein